MAQFESARDQLKALGAALVFIAAEKRGGTLLAMAPTTGMVRYTAERYLRDHPILFPFLLDEDRQVTKAYGVYHAFGKDAFRIAHPASFVIDSTGVVRYAYVSRNQLDRAPLEEVVKAVVSC